MQLLWIGLTACRSAFSIFIISGPGRTVKPVLGAFYVYFRLIKRNVCSKVCSRKAKERKNQRSYALSFGAEDGTFPRTKKQSSGLFFAACGRPCCSSPQLRMPNKNPHGGVRHGDLCLVRKMGLEPTRHRHTHLKRACLPIPALPQIAFDCKKDSSTFGGIKSSPILQLFPAWGAPVKSQHLFLCTVPRLAKIVCAQ